MNHFEESTKCLEDVTPLCGCGTDKTTVMYILDETLICLTVSKLPIVGMFSPAFSVHFWQRV